MHPIELNSSEKLKIKTFPRISFSTALKFFLDNSGFPFFLPTKAYKDIVGWNEVIWDKFKTTYTYRYLIFNSIKV